MYLHKWKVIQKRRSLISAKLWRFHLFFTMILKVEELWLFLAHRFPLWVPSLSHFYAAVQDYPPGLEGQVQQNVEQPWNGSTTPAANSHTRSTLHWTRSAPESNRPLWSARDLLRAHFGAWLLLNCITQAHQVDRTSACEYTENLLNLQN